MSVPNVEDTMKFSANDKKKKKTKPKFSFGYIKKKKKQHGVFLVL